MKSKTLGEACANGDGTYNGLKLMQWLFEALTGKPLSDKDMSEIAADARKIADLRRQS